MDAETMQALVNRMDQLRLEIKSDISDMCKQIRDKEDKIISRMDKLEEDVAENKSEIRSFKAQVGLVSFLILVSISIFEIFYK